MDDGRGEISRALASPFMASSFRQLPAYQLSAALSRDLRAVVTKWPAFERWSIGMQLVRAAGSVGANIAEGSGRWHRPDQRRFAFQARGSLCETEHWVLEAQSAGLLDEQWNARVDEAARSLNRLIRSWPTK
jgi:four helix bundle protein